MDNIVSEEKFCSSMLGYLYSGGADDRQASNKLNNLMVDLELPAEDIEKVMSLCQSPVQSPTQLEIPTGEDEKADDDADESKICVVCLNHWRKCIVKDCGHAVLCIACSKIILSAVKKECPTCRTKIEKGIGRFYD